jgi:hypothetical protein
MNLILILVAACSILAPTVIILALALAKQTLRLTAIDRRIQTPPVEFLPEAVESLPIQTALDSSPKAPELNVFAAKVSFAGWELRDMIEAVSVACSPYNSDDILSKTRHAFDLINQYRLDHGLPAISEPRIDASRRPNRLPSISSLEGDSKVPCTTR